MRPSSIRPASIAIVLGLTTLLAGVLAMEAISASRRHRQSAERVLRDYAALGAEAVSSRIGTFLAGRFYVVLTASAGAGTRTPSPSQLRNSLGEGGRQVLDQVNRILRLEQAPSVTSASGETPTGDLDSVGRLVKTASQSLPPSAYFGSAWIAGSAGPELLVFQPFRKDTGSVSALTIPVAGLAILVEPLLTTETVLPASLTRGTTVREGIGIRLTGSTGVVHSRDYDTVSYYRAGVPLGPMFSDLTVEVSLHESLAPILVIGGIPPSRLPLLGALLMVTVILTVAAGYQLARERELARLREDFVASVSHELRTPLAQIRLFAETLRLGRIRSEGERDRSLEIVEHESRRLEHLVENILHFSRVERGAQHIRPEPTDLTALVEQIVSEFTPLGERTGATFRTVTTPALIANVDPSAIRQVLLNLLDNAIKYGPRDQVVTVRLSADGGAVRMEVEDEGPGVPAPLRARVWDRFWRDDSVRASGVAGTGIGLAIVRELVSLHRGSATIEDAVPRGARVVITLGSVKG